VGRNAGKESRRREKKKKEKGVWKKKKKKKGGEVGRQRKGDTRLERQEMGHEERKMGREGKGGGGG